MIPGINAMARFSGNLQVQESSEGATSSDILRGDAYQDFQKRVKTELKPDTSIFAMAGHSHGRSPASTYDYFEVSKIQVGERVYDCPAENAPSTPAWPKNRLQFEERIHDLTYGLLRGLSFGLLSHQRSDNMATCVADFNRSRYFNQVIDFAKSLESGKPMKTSLFSFLRRSA